MAARAGAAGPAAAPHQHHGGGGGGGGPGVSGGPAPVRQLLLCGLVPGARARPAAGLRVPPPQRGQQGRGRLGGPGAAPLLRRQARHGCHPQPGRAGRPGQQSHSSAARAGYCPLFLTSGGQTAVV